MIKVFAVLLFCGLTLNCLCQVVLPDQGSIVSAKIQDVNTNQELLNQSSNTRLIPASLTKVVTTATAIELLGADYTYKTDFYISEGYIKDGVLQGNLIVVSGGDPTLGSKYFEKTNPDSLFYRIAQELQKHGVKTIEGGIVFDMETVAYSAPRLWEDMGNYYGAIPQDFNWRDNTITVTLSSGNVGTECRVVKTEPSLYPYQLDCRVLAASHSKDSAYVYGIQEIEKWWIEGSIPSNRSAFKVKAAMPKPYATFENELVEYLKGVGIRVNIDNDIAYDSNWVKLLHYESPCLSDIIQVVNHKSNNLFADGLLLTLGKEFKHAASWDKGNEVVSEFWKDKIDFASNFRLRDGSGLTPKNLISAEGMVQLLSWMKLNGTNYQSFESSLAKGGESGTLRSVFKHPDIKGCVIGKSGSMEGVLGYCGYITTREGKDAAFCIIANNYLIATKEIRTTLDSIITEFILAN